MQLIFLIRINDNIMTCLWFVCKSTFLFAIGFPSTNEAPQFDLIDFYVNFLASRKCHWNGIYSLWYNATFFLMNINLIISWKKISLILMSKWIGPNILLLWWFFRHKMKIDKMMFKPDPYHNEYWPTLWNYCKSMKYI